MRKSNGYRLGIIIPILILILAMRVPAQKTNIIIMIADGWGYNQILATNYWNGMEPAFTSWEVAYPMSTYMNAGEYDVTRVWTEFNYVKSKYTDSAAAATAMSTGYKTYSGAIGVDASKNNVELIAERADSLGMATGVISTVEISHATPAGFGAHSVSRSNYTAIGAQMIEESALDVIMGAGHPLYDDNNSDAGSISYQYVGGEDTWNALMAGSAGADADADGVADPWSLVQTKEEFQALMTGDTPKRVAGIAKVRTTLQQNRANSSKTELPYSNPLNVDVPTLGEMAKGALNVLDNDPDGLFLMIEGGAVDWANHSNLLGRMIEEMNDFNAAVDSVIAWVEANSDWEETLLVVTGDHETGYLWGPDSGLPDIFNPIVDNGPGVMPGYQYNSGDHTNSLIPLFAKGLGSDQFAQYATEEDSVRGPFIDNTNIAFVAFDLLGGFVPTSVESNTFDALPDGFSMGNAYPNPFNPSVSIPFYLENDGDVTVQVFDILGRSVYKSSERYYAGSRLIQLDADSFEGNLTSGSYVLCLTHSGERLVQKINLLK